MNQKLKGDFSVRRANSGELRDCLVFDESSVSVLLPLSATRLGKTNRFIVGTTNVLLQ